MPKGTYKDPISRNLRISHSKTGKKRAPFSKEWKLNMRKHLIGNQWNKGKKHTKETKLLWSKQRSGKNHPNWKGGITQLNSKTRNALDMKLWRKAVLERDNFICQKTMIQGGKLIAHHINNFATFPELRTSIGNGITLSQKSHNEFHKKYGRKNNTKQQIEKFLIKK